MEGFLAITVENILHLIRIGQKLAHWPRLTTIQSGRHDTQQVQCVFFLVFADLPENCSNSNETQKRAHFIQILSPYACYLL